MRFSGHSHNELCSFFNGQKGIKIVNELTEVLGYYLHQKVEDRPLAIHQRK